MLRGYVQVLGHKHSNIIDVRRNLSSRAAGYLSVAQN